MNLQRIAEYAVAFGAIVALTLPHPAHAWTLVDPGKDSWATSDYNFDNSPLNFANNPINWRNQELNMSRKNKVYDEDGDDIGYTVTTPKGITNVWSHDGKLLGRLPAGH